MALRVADLDGDGQPDLGACNSDGTVALLLQDLGAFSSSAVHLEANGVRSLGSADLNGDGLLDLIPCGSDLAVRFQEGSGVFDASPQVLGNASLTESPLSVAAGDIDGDGDLDLVVGSAGNGASGRLSIFSQEHSEFSGRLLPGSGLENINNPWTVHIADLDGDGAADIVAAGGEFRSGPTIFFQEGPGEFPVAQSLGGRVFENRSVAVGDVDRDGDLDLVYVRGSQGGTVLVRQSLFRTFFPAVSLPGAETQSVVLTDLDGNGELDVASGDSRLVLHYQHDGQFGAAVLVGDVVLGSTIVQLAAADLNGDGMQDLAAARNGVFPQLAVFLQGASGSFASDPLLLSGAGGGINHTYVPSSVVAGDVDGDGRLELVAANYLAEVVEVFDMDGRRSVGGPGITSRPRFATLADIDGDGDPDIVSANEVSDSVTVFWNSH